MVPHRMYAVPMADLAGRDPLVVAGIDPGTQRMGYGVVARIGDELKVLDHGVFRIPPGTGLSARLCRLHVAVLELLRHHKPDVVSLELAFHHRNVQSALRLGEVRASVHIAAHSLGLPVFEYAPAVAKKSVTGHGGSTKEVVGKMVAEQLGLAEVPEPHDAADALALALCLLYDPALDPRFAESS